jgi:DNA-binding GntR family transcriptional regulator
MPIAGGIWLRRTLTDQAYSAIDELIVTGKLMPGTVLKEEALAKSLSMSRTPVREAIVRLEKDGLVERKKSRVTVVEITYSRAADICVLRAALDGTAARLAAAAAVPSNLEDLHRITVDSEKAINDGRLKAAISLHNEYHDYVVRMSQNDDLVAASVQANALSRRFRHISSMSVDVVRQSIETDKAMLQALRNGDGDRCDSLMCEDIFKSGSALLEILQVFFGVDKVTPAVEIVLSHSWIDAAGES